MTKLFGKSANYLLFTDGANAVVIDQSTNMVENTGELAVLASAQAWRKANIAADQVHHDLAAGALADLRVQVVVASGRMYTIPKGVQAEAEKALEWRKEHSRGGTPVGLNTARILAEGGQIGLKKVRHIAKYFPRHEVDKKAKGWDMGEDNFPSNGRIAWALWGGDPGWRWAQAIVERERKKGTIAGGFVVSSDDEMLDYAPRSAYDASVDEFGALEIDEEQSREFVARVRLDESGIDRLYMVDELGDVKVWDGGAWDDAGLTDADIFSLDLALDADDDGVERSHIFIDSDSALILSAHLQQSPFKPVTVFDLDDDEAMLVAAAADEMDWNLIDAVVSAAEQPAQGQGDGEYTPEERSQKARKQVRDATGKFAAMGSRVAVKSQQNRQGNIVGINPDTQSVRVRYDDGSESEVPATDTTKAADMKPMNVEVPSETDRLDTSGILGQPRAPIDRPNARIPSGLPALTPDQLRQVVADFPAWVKSQRDRQQAAATARRVPSRAELEESRSSFVRDLERRSGVEFDENLGDLREHPLYSKLFKKKPIYNLYYNPMISAATVTDDEPMTPTTSDVQPMYMAIVSPDDPRAVFDLIAIVPASAKSTTPVTYKRVDQKWERDDQILADLTSPTPPPVVPLSGEDLQDTLMQLDGVMASGLVAVGVEGGLDRNRGNAERLRRYWLYGKGALKIRWNTPGDWTRCYRQLRKYMGVRAKGYCSLRHKEATGVWPGSKYNIGKKKKGMRGGGFYEDIAIPSEQQVADYVYTRARIADARARVLLAGGLEMLEKRDGARFKIPLVIPEDTESGDGRIFKKGSIEVRQLPLPLLWQIHTAEGHNGSVVVGRIDGMERTDRGIGNAYGVFDSGAYGQEVERMVREGFVRGVSADLDKFEASETEAEDTEAAKKKDKKKKIGGDKIVIDHARVMAVTIVPKPAFQECSIHLDEETNVGESQEEYMNSMPDGVYAEDVDDTDAEAIVACGMVAGSIPTVPPAEWFTNPKLTGATPLTVDDAGRVFGHIAAWNTNHIGMAYGTRPPRSKSKYAYFHTGVLRADDGKDYPVGQLTLAGGHASLEASAVDAAKHYDDTGSAIADVTAGEDAYGIWVAGALRPAATPEQVRALRASAPSGDWRPINGALELVAVCQVNVPGFPIARARVASGQVYALVAAGARVLAKMKSDPITELAARIDALESATAASTDVDERAELAARAEAARAKFDELRIAAGGEIAKVDPYADLDLSARVASAKAEAELGAISMRVRERLAKEGKALPDGSYPIRNVEDLKNAIQSYGRAKKSNRAKVRRHIMKRARALGKSDLVPEQWKAASAIEEDLAEIRAQVASAKERLSAEDDSK
jgi:hypothetical protein